MNLKKRINYLFKKSIERIFEICIFFALILFFSNLTGWFLFFRSNWWKNIWKKKSNCWKLRGNKIDQISLAVNMKIIWSSLIEVKWVKNQQLTHFIIIVIIKNWNFFSFTFFWSFFHIFIGFEWRSEYIFFIFIIIKYRWFIFDSWKSNIFKKLIFVFNLKENNF